MNDRTTPPSPTPANPARRAALGGLGALTAAAAATAPGTARATTAAKPLEGRVALVTGARSNQGRAYAVALAELGADVVLHFHRTASRDENEETIRQVRSRGVRTAHAHGDLGDVERVRELFDVAQRAFGRIDVVVNTVGVIVKKPLVEVTEADYERSHRANTKAALFVMQEAAKRVADGGRIVQIGTSLTAGTAPGYALYAGTKAPAEEFTRMLAREIGRRGVTVNYVGPGPLDNSFFHAAETPQSAAYAAGLSTSGRLGRESDVAPLVAFLASPQSQWINGQVLWVNGGYLTR